MDDQLTEIASDWIPTGEFKIVADKKRIVTKSCSGQVIEALKRAKAPLSPSDLVARVRRTKAGKALKVQDIKARVLKCAEWYVNDDEGYVAKTEEGEYFLVRVPA